MISALIFRKVVHLTKLKKKKKIPQDSSQLNRILAVDVHHPCLFIGGPLGKGQLPSSVLTEWVCTEKTPLSPCDEVALGFQVCRTRG